MSFKSWIERNQAASASLALQIEYLSGSVYSGTSSLATTASYALTASYLLGSVTSASYASTASYVLNAVSSSYSLTASYALNAGSTIDTGSFVTTSSFNNFTGSYNTGSFTGSFTGSLLGTSSYAVSASYAPSTPPFPYTGSALITGSLGVTGSASILAYTSSSANIFSIRNPANDTDLFKVQGDGWLVNKSTPTSKTLTIYSDTLLSYLYSDGAVSIVGSGQGDLRHDSWNLRTSAAAGYGTLSSTEGLRFYALNLILGSNFPNGTKQLSIETGSAPTSTGTNAFSLYSADITEGNAAPHFLTETGSIIKLYQQPAVTSSQGIADVLTNIGFISASSIIANPVSSSYATTASYVLNAVSSSYATTASYVANASSFPYTGSALITGSLGVTGSASILAYTSSAANILTVRNSDNTADMFSIRGNGTLFTTWFNDAASTIINGTRTGAAATAIGYQTSAGLRSIAVGYSVDVSGIDGVAVGYNIDVEAAGASGIAFGATIAGSQNGYSFGRNITNGVGIAIGKDISFSGDTNNTHFIGYGLTDTSNYTETKTYHTFGFGSYGSTGNKPGLTFRSNNLNQLLLGYYSTDTNYSDISGSNWMGIKNGTPPSGSLDAFQIFSADITAGNAAPHFRTETGSIIKLYQQAAVTSSQGIADVLTNLGFISASSIIANPISASYAATASLLLGSVVSASYALSASYAPGGVSDTTAIEAQVWFLI